MPEFRVTVHIVSGSKYGPVDQQKVTAKNEAEAAVHLLRTAYQRGLIKNGQKFEVDVTPADEDNWRTVAAGTVSRKEIGL